MLHYPSWRYHPEKEPIIVHSAEQDAALGALWCDSPAKFVTAESAALVDPVDPVAPASDVASHVASEPASITLVGSIPSVASVARKPRKRGSA